MLLEMALSYYEFDYESERESVFDEEAFICVFFPNIGLILRLALVLKLG
jgi:hypothetical protein